MESITKEDDDSRIAIQIFKMKNLFKRLELAKVSGSVVSIFIPPKKQISDITNMLLDESGKADHIKDRNNRNSVIEAQNSARQRLKLYRFTPKNGLILFCGLVMEENERTEKKILIDFEPFRPVNLSMYFCDSKFHLNELKGELLSNQPPFGFIVVDGSGALFATLQGNAKEIIHKFSAELPKKHRRGGQSAQRFGRIRVEKRHYFLMKVCQAAIKCFITDNKCNVSGLILAGSADFKTDLNTTQMFDPRLQSKVCGIVDVSYGFENGLNQAIELSQGSLHNVRYVKQKQLIASFLTEISMDSGMVVYGVSDTMKVLEGGGLAKILCFEDLDYKRVIYKNKETEKNIIRYLTPEQSLISQFEGNTQLEKVQEYLLSEWLSVHYKDFGAELEFISDKSPEGTQFCKGFAGLGGFLRFKTNIDHLLDESQQWQKQDDEFV